MTKKPLNISCPSWIRSEVYIEMKQAITARIPGTYSFQQNDKYGDAEDVVLIMDFDKNLLSIGLYQDWDTDFQIKLEYISYKLSEYMHRMKEIAEAWSKWDDDVAEYEANFGRSDNDLDDIDSDNDSNGW